MRFHLYVGSIEDTVGSSYRYCPVMHFAGDWFVIDTLLVLSSEFLSFSRLCTPKFKDISPFLIE